MREWSFCKINYTTYFGRLVVAVFLRSAAFNAGWSFFRVEIRGEIVTLGGEDRRSMIPKMKPATHFTHARLNQHSAEGRRWGEMRFVHLGDIVHSERLSWRGRERERSWRLNDRIPPYPFPLGGSAKPVACPSGANKLVQLESLKENW